MSVLKRAAMTEAEDGSLLFVHAGLNPTRALTEQGDNFWWDATGFDRAQEPYENFKRVFRGADPAGRGVRMDGYAVTLDAGCGTGGPLIAAAVLPDGRIVDTIQG
jgi:serine/threonine protein phosphatase 1